MLPKDDAGWAPCAEGTLSSTVARVRSKRRQANLLRFGASTLTGALLLVVASFYLSPSSIDLDSINRECRDVGGMLAGYVAGDLNQENRQLVEQHLVNCEKCRMKLREMQAGEMQASEIQAGEMATQTALALSSQVYHENLLLSSIQPMPLAID
jgi:hypothetical protein